MSTHYKNTSKLDDKYILPTSNQFKLNLYLKLRKIVQKPYLILDQKAYLTSLDWNRSRYI
jgi:uncharacterized protein YutE (UPF0331/DUF86 family)